MSNQSPKTLASHAVAAVCNLCLGFGLSIIISGCGVSRSGLVSKVKHDAGKPVRSELAWNWRSVTDEDYAKVMAPVLGIEPSTILPQSHPLTAQAQEWIDRIDSKLRETHAAKLANVPKPRAKVLDKAVPNAFVAPVPACYKVAVKLSRKATGRGKKDVQVLIEPQNGSVQAWEADAPCIDGTENQSAEETVADFVSSFNAASTNGCKFSVDSSGSLVVGDKCEVDAALAGVAGADALVLLQTANHITVHSGIVTIMSESAFVSVLAHELGHYYRSHPTANDADYGYFYTQQSKNVAKRPSPESRLEQLGKDAIKATEAIDGGSHFTQVKGQVLRSELYFLLGSLVTKSKDSSKACVDARKLASSSDFEGTMAMFPVDPKLSSEQTAAYLKFEEGALDCLDNLALAGSGESVRNSFDWKKLRSVAANPTWPNWLDQLTPSFRNALDTLNKELADKIGEDSAESSGRSVGAVLRSINKKLMAVEEDALVVLKKAQDTRLGQYTFEQEADDLAVEITASLGFDPEVVVDAMRSLGKTSHGQPRDLSLGYDDCDTLWKNNWLDAQNNYVFVPVGGFTDPHHSICYRMFNIEREIAAHGVVPAKSKLPAHDDAAWTDLQNDVKIRVQTLVDEADMPFPAVTAVLKSTGALGCVFNQSRAGK